jgi:hypothetical protein
MQKGKIMQKGKLCRGENNVKGKTMHEDASLAYLALFSGNKKKTAFWKFEPGSL